MEEIRRNRSKKWKYNGNMNDSITTYFLELEFPFPQYFNHQIFTHTLLLQLDQVQKPF